MGTQRSKLGFRNKNYRNRRARPSLQRPLHPTAVQEWQKVQSEKRRDAEEGTTKFAELLRSSSVSIEDITFPLFYGNATLGAFSMREDWKSDLSRKTFTDICLCLDTGISRQAQYECRLPLIVHSCTIKKVRGHFTR